MAAKQPPPSPQTMDPADERKVQLFLERAAPIVLENRVLDSENWQRLVVLAKELDLTDGQLRATVEDLKRRGVIERIDLQPDDQAHDQPTERTADESGEKTVDEPANPSRKKPSTQSSKPSSKPSRKTPGKPPNKPPAQPATKRQAKPTPKPPPLPVRPTAAERDDEQPSRDGQADGSAPGNAQPGREKTFSLNSPVPPQPPPPPPPPATSSGTPNPPPAAAPPPRFPLPRSEPAPSEPAKVVVLREQLAERAAAIIAEQRGFGPKTHSLIALAAEGLGLSDRDVVSVMRSLQPDNNQSSDAAEDANQRRRWKEEGKPEPPRHEAPKKPHEVFSAFVAKSLEKLAIGHVSVDLEEGLVAHGTKVLKLSQVYATQLTREVARQRGLLLESDTRLQTQAGENEQVDPKVQTFLDRATPILAQNRGLNARSRVLLGAMAEEVGLAPSEVDDAVALLESKPTKTDGLDEDERLRLAPFRLYAVELLGQLPQRILTARVHTMMVERGEERFGVGTERTKAVLRELANEQQIQIITEEEALRHIEGLVGEQLGDELRLETEVRYRILQEGGQWGLSAEQIENIIKQGSRKNYQKRRSERNLTNAALVAALVAVLLVAGFLGWAILGRQMTPVEPTPEPPPTVMVEASAPVADADESWWSVELVWAIHNASTEFPLLRRNLKSIGARDPEYRASAYDVVIKQALYQSHDPVQRNMLFSVISQAYAIDPDEAAAAKIRELLTDFVPGPGAKLSDRADDYRRIFWAMQGAVAALQVSADHANRADALAQSIGRVVGTTIDRKQPILQLERQCLGALAERLYRLMIASTASQHADMRALQPVIADEAGRYLDQPQLESLQADFLSAFLATSADSWTAFETLIDDSMANRDPLIVAKMIDIYETTANGSLRRHLESGLLRRANHKPMAEEPRDIADEIRQALGITEVVTAEGRTLDFLQLAKRELARTSEELDERMKALRLTVRLSQVTTLGCALAQGDQGFSMFDEMIKEVPTPLTVGEPDEDSLFPASLGTDWDALERIDSAVSRLQREGSGNRVDRIESIARVAGRVRDLKPTQANLLANYLLAQKSSIEHERVLEHVPEFRRWSRLHLAVADGIYHTTMQAEPLRELLSRLLDEEVALGEGDAGRETVRGALLRRARTSITTQGQAAVDAGLIDQARGMLRDQYVRQANLLGVPETAYAEATGPADVLRPLIEHYSSRLLERGASAEATTQLKAIPHQLQAIEYVATNQLQETVLLERIWLRLLTTELKRMTSSDSEEADRILRDLSQADQAAGNSFAQLHASQVAFVHMWMLWNRPSK